MQKHSSSQKSHGLLCVVCVCIAGTKETRFTYIYYQWESSRSFQLMFPDTLTAAAQKHQHTVTYSVGLSLLATSWTLKSWSSLWTVPGVPSFAHCHAKSPEKRFVYVQSARRGQKLLNVCRASAAIPSVLSGPLHVRGLVSWHVARVDPKFFLGHTNLQRESLQLRASAGL